MNLDALGPKVGPFPVGVWVLLVAGGAGIGVVLRRRNAPDNEAKQATFEAAQRDFAVRSSGTSTSNAPAGGSNTVVGAPDAPTTNEAWRRQAVSQLIEGGVSPLVAEQSIGRYLTGQVLDGAQQQALELALRKLGAPPDFVPPANVTPPDPPNTNPVGGYPKPEPDPTLTPPAYIDVGTTPSGQTIVQPAPAAQPAAPAPQPAPLGEQPQPQFRVHTVERGDTLWGITQRYLGDGSRWQDTLDYTNFFRGNAGEAPLDPYNLPIGARVAVRVA